MKLVIEIPDDLLETQFFCQYFGVWSGKLQETFMKGFQLIDNHENEAYQQGYTDGWKERFGEPERPHGEWIWKKDEDALRTYDLLCSECGYKIFTCENYDNVEQAKKVVEDRIREGKTLFPFCPNCGARMKND